MTSKYRPIVMRANRLLGASLVDHNLVKLEDLEQANGRLLEVTQPDAPFGNMSRLSTHVEVIYLAFAALYWFVSDPRVLFAVQTLFVCAAIVLVFLIARMVLASPKKALAVALAAALYPALQFMTLSGRVWYWLSFAKSMPASPRQGMVSRSWPPIGTGNAEPWFQSWERHTFWRHFTRWFRFSTTAANQPSPRRITGKWGANPGLAACLFLP